MARALRPNIGIVRVALGLLALGALVLAATARAGTPSPRHEPQLDATVRFLQEDQNADGGFGGEPGAASDPDFTAWVAMSLAAVGVNPRSQEKPGGRSAYTYLAEHAGELSLTTDFERALLAVEATEAPPGPLGGVDLVSRILEGRLPDGSFAHDAGGSRAGMNDTIFAILALSPVREPAVESVVREAAEWVVAQQNENGSWPAVCPRSGAECAPAGSDPEDNVDMTGAAIEALNAAGLANTSAQDKALEYLRQAQLLDGGFPEGLGEGESNVASTAWAVQGIWAAGGDPETWRTGAGGTSEEPLDYMTSMQQPDGHIRYRRSRESLGVWMTSYVLPALAGRALPIVPPPPPSPPPAEIAGAPPTGGAAPSGTGVIAGGGGRGAPLFSRPQPQSKGTTPGGARIVHRQGLGPATNQATSRRGADQHQPTGTETGEPTGPSASGEVSSVSAAATPTFDDEAGGAEGSGSGGGGGPGGPARGARGDGVPAAATGRAASANRSGDDVVSGTLIGAAGAKREGKLAYGAPGLRSGAGGSGEEQWLAIAIGAAALLVASIGAGRERRRELVL